MDALQFHQLIPTYRRNSDDPNGAVRASYIETIAMEQMPGGRCQIAARTNGGDGAFITPIQANLQVGRKMLETMRRFLGGEPPPNNGPESPLGDVLNATPRTITEPDADNDFMKDV